MLFPTQLFSKKHFYAVFILETKRISIKKVSFLRVSIFLWVFYEGILSSEKCLKLGGFSNRSRFDEAREPSNPFLREILSWKRAPSEVYYFLKTGFNCHLFSPSKIFISKTHSRLSSLRYCEFLKIRLMKWLNKPIPLKRILKRLIFWEKSFIE